MNVDANEAFGAVLEVCRADVSRSPLHTQFPSERSSLVQAYKAAADHGVKGLFYRKLSEFAPDVSDEWNTIRSSALTGAWRCYRMLDELILVGKSFRENAIDWIAFKGPALAIHAYPKISDRSFTDLDILIRPNDLLRASNLLRERGYSIDPNFAPLEELLDRRYEYHARFERTDGAVIELHWALNPGWTRVQLDMEGIWRRAQTVSLDGNSLSVLALEDTILQLCVHGFKHQWSQLKWLMDIAYLVRDSVAIDWTWLEHEARVVGCYRILLLGLGLASELLGIALPEQLQNEIAKDRIVRKLIRLHLSAIGQDRSLTLLEAMVSELYSREGFWAHLKSSWLLLPRIFRLTTEDHAVDASILLRLKAIARRPVRLYRTFGWKWVRAVLELR